MQFNSIFIIEKIVIFYGPKFFGFLYPKQTLPLPNVKGRCILKALCKWSRNFHQLYLLDGVSFVLFLTGIRESKCCRKHIEEHLVQWREWISLNCSTAVWLVSMSYCFLSFKRSWFFLIIYIGNFFTAIMLKNDNYANIHGCWGGKGREGTKRDYSGKIWTGNTYVIFSKALTYLYSCLARGEQRFPMWMTKPSLQDMLRQKGEKCQISRPVRQSSEYSKQRDCRQQIKKWPCIIKKEHINKELSVTREILSRKHTNKTNQVSLTRPHTSTQPDPSLVPPKLAQEMGTSSGAAPGNKPFVSTPCLPAQPSISPQTTQGHVGHFLPSLAWVTMLSETGYP